MNFYDELDVESVLQCPVCFELPQNVIFLCRVGHHMCDKCRKRLSSCPTCQSALTGARNFLAEALISKFAVFKDGGDGPNEDTTSFKEDSRELRILRVPQGLYRCQLESCFNRKGLGVGQLISHAEQKHTQLFEKFQNRSATFTHNFKKFCFSKTNHKYHRAFHVTNMTLFFLHLEVITGQYMHCWISTPAPENRSNQFDYLIEFYNENNSKRIPFVSKMSPSECTSQWLLERGKVFVIPPQSHQLEQGHLFSILVKIVFKDPPQ